MMGMGKYVLSGDGQRPIPCADVLAWGLWFEHSAAIRRVGRTQVGEFRVSTVFLGLDHGWVSPVPILWETMVFRGEDGESFGMERCSGNREQAEAMHEAMVAKLEAQEETMRTEITS